MAIALRFNVAMVRVKVTVINEASWRVWRSECFRILQYSKYLVLQYQVHVYTAVHSTVVADTSTAVLLPVVQYGLGPRSART